MTFLKNFPKTSFFYCATFAIFKLIPFHIPCEKRESDGRRRMTMKKAAKKLLGAALILSLAAGYIGIPAQAKDMLDGYEVSGSVSTNSNSATAVTSYSQPATIKAQAFVSFTYGMLFLENASDIAVAQIGGVSATAAVPSSGNAVVTGGRGEHWVTKTGDWHKTTRIGNSKS